MSIINYKHFTLGVEEEYMVMDPTTGELKSHEQRIVQDIKYINYEDGKHDVETWGKAMPAFLLWGWGKK